MSLQILKALYSDHICSEISPTEKEQAWPQEGEYSYRGACWTAFKNRLTLNKFLHWLQEESGLEEKPSVWPSWKDLPSFWEEVNGTAIEIGKTRIVIIPSESISADEFCIPAEWVDIPNWAADYYLAVQVDYDDNWLRVWGFTTHSKLKKLGRYDKIYRTYSLEHEELIEDLDVMWIARESESDHKVEIAPLPTLSPAQIEQLLEQVGKRTPYSPRLDVPFEQWGALLASDDLRQRLYERRTRTSSEAVSRLKQRLVQLGKWFEGIFEEGWQSEELVFAGAKGIRSSSNTDELEVSGAKLIRLSEETVALIVRQKQINSEQIEILLRLYPVSESIYLPERVELTVLDGEGKPIPKLGKQAQADNWLQLKFKGNPGDQFSIQVNWQENSITESFII